MNKLSCGVFIIAVGMSGMANSTITSLPALVDDVGGGGAASSAGRDGTNSNFKQQGEINSIFKDAINANESLANQAMNTANTAASSATAAATSAADALSIVGGVQTNVTKLLDTVNGVIDKVDDAFVQSKEARELSTTTSSRVDALDIKVTDYQAATTSNVTAYQNQTTERVNQFEQTVNTNMSNYQSTIDGRVNTIQNEVGEVKESIQGAINDSANALIKSNNAELIANQANLTAQRAEDGLAQEIVDRKADVERGVREANAYTDSKFKDFTNQIEQTKKFAAAGTAAALAASQIPQVSQGSAFSLGLGMGNYSGQSALSIGMSARLGDYTVTKVAFTSDTQNNVGAGMAIAVEW